VITASELGNSMPTMSVVMPCHNHGRFLAESVESILNQTYKQLELIIVDDGSSDDSRDVILALARKDSRIRVVLHDRNRGASNSRNDGVRAAQGDFISFCDADDLWMPEKLSVQLKILEENKRYDVVYSDAVIIDGNGANTGQRFSQVYRLPRNPSGFLFKDLCLRNFINMQTVMLRRDCVQPGELFDERIRWVEDWWCWTRLSKQHLFFYSEQPLSKYRVHSRSTNVVQVRGVDANRYKVFKRTLKYYPDLDGMLRSQVWYHMGCCLLNLGRPRLARRFFCQALRISLRHLSTAPQCVRPLARLLWGIK
jgi:glycosyltransferase involved in cell wall biosynthesis